MTRILVATDNGLHEVEDPVEGAAAIQFDGYAVSALAIEGDRVWAVVDDRSVVCRQDGHWDEVARLDRLRAASRGSAARGDLRSPPTRRQ